MGERAEKVAEKAALGSEDLLSVLKSRIEALVGRHGEAKAKVSTLTQQLAAKDEELRELRAKLKQSDQLRSDASRRVKDLISKVDKLRQLENESTRTAHA